MVRGGGKVVMGGLFRCSHKDSCFSTACTAVLVTDDDDDNDGGAVRTYKLWHTSLQVDDGGLTVV